MGWCHILLWNPSQKEGGWEVNLKSINPGTLFSDAFRKNVFDALPFTVHMKTQKSQPLVAHGNKAKVLTLSFPWNRFQFGDLRAFRLVRMGADVR